MENRIEEQCSLSNYQSDNSIKTNNIANDKNSGNSDNKELSLFPELETSDENNNIKRKKQNIYFDFELQKFININENDVSLWQKAYPSVSILRELKKMESWADANIKKAKKDWKRFINLWLNREQNYVDEKNSKVQNRNNYLSSNGKCITVQPKNINDYDIYS
jgi:hypothetical protein